MLGNFIYVTHGVSPLMLSQAMTVKACFHGVMLELPQRIGFY